MLRYAGCTVKGQESYVGIIKAVQKMLGGPLSSLEEIADTKGLNRIKWVLQDPRPLSALIHASVPLDTLLNVIVPSLTLLP